jgi:hypothetical protein
MAVRLAKILKENNDENEWRTADNSGHVLNCTDNFGPRPGPSLAGLRRKPIRRTVTK